MAFVQRQRMSQDVARVGYGTLVYHVPIGSLIECELCVRVRVILVVEGMWVCAASLKCG